MVLPPMIKLFKFYLSVCILLLTAFVQRHGGTHEAVYFFSLQNRNISAFSDHGVLTSNLHLNFKPDRADKGRKSAVSVALNVEEKEDESDSSKRYTTLSKDFYAASYTQTAMQFGHYIRKSKFHNKHFTYFPSYRFLYLKLKVFRI